MAYSVAYGKSEKTLRPSKSSNETRERINPTRVSTDACIAARNENGELGGPHGGPLRVLSERLAAAGVDPEAVLDAIASAGFELVETKSVGL